MILYVGGWAAAETAPVFPSILHSQFCITSLCGYSTDAGASADDLVLELNRLFWFPQSHFHNYALLCGVSVGTMLRLVMGCWWAGGWVGDGTASVILIRTISYPQFGITNWWWYYVDAEALAGCGQLGQKPGNWEFGRIFLN